MKATIETPTPSIPAHAPDADPVERTHRPVRRHTRAMVAAVLVAVMSAAVAVGSVLDDGGVQRTEADFSPPPTTGPQELTERTTASGVGDRDALIVEVAGAEARPAIGTEAPSTSPSPSHSSTSSTAGADGAVETSINGDVAAGTALTAETPTLATGPSDSTRQAARPSRTAAGSGGSGPASTATTAAPVVTSEPLSPSMSTSTASGFGDGWEEHFDELDTGRWRVEHSTYGDGNGERQCYQPDNVRVSNGRLILTARSETATCPNGSTRSVTSGMVRSRNLAFSPGQAIEFRVKLTPPNPSNQAGLWPAVWASSWAGSWPRGGELDFLEVMTAEDPRRAVFSMHYADRSGGHELQNKAVPLTGYFSDGWHTIRFDYGRNGGLVWYLDGSRVFSVSAAGTAQGYPAPFDQTIDEIKLNLAVGGSPGPLATGVLDPAGATFEIDYIRVFDL